MAASAGLAVNDAVGRLTSLEEDLQDLQPRSWALFDSSIAKSLGFAVFLDGRSRRRDRVRRRRRGQRDAVLGDPRLSR